MWFQPYSWFEASKLCSGKDGEDILFDRGWAGELDAQNRIRGAFSVA